MSENKNNQSDSDDSYLNVLNIIGDNFVDQDKKVTLGKEEINSLEFIGVYQSGLWCPSCVTFTPFLAQFYNQINQNKKRLEIIYASKDRNFSMFESYFSKMPWLAIEFDNSYRKNYISQYIKVRTIPNLHIFDNKGRLISGDARNEVQELGLNAYQHWVDIKNNL